MGLILAALQAGKNPAKAPATISMTTVVMAILKLTEGLVINSVSTIGPINSNSNKPKNKPKNPAMAVTKIDSCKIN